MFSGSFFESCLCHLSKLLTFAISKFIGSACALGAYTSEKATEGHTVVKNTSYCMVLDELIDGFSRVLQEYFKYPAPLIVNMVKCQMYHTVCLYRTLYFRLLLCLCSQVQQNDVDAHGRSHSLSQCDLTTACMARGS